MNSIWLKIAGVVVVLFIVLIVGASLFSPDKPNADSQSAEISTPAKPENTNKTIYDVAEEDQQKYAIPPSDPPVATPPAIVADIPPAPAPQPTVIYIKKLNDIDDIQAQKLYSAVIPGKSIGGLRAGFNLTAQNAKQIIKDYPDSVYAFQAKRVLAAIPERYRATYHLTDELLDVSMFFKKRPGTIPQQIQLED